MKFSAMKFDTPNNASQSLRVIAELVRHGDITLDLTRNTEAPRWLRIDIYDTRERGPA